MSFYQLSKPERIQLVQKMEEILYNALIQKQTDPCITYFIDSDTYIRKNAYLIIGKLFSKYISIQNNILSILNSLLHHDDFKVRQTVINAAGEIGKKNFAVVSFIFEHSLFDEHHAPRNAVIGSLKKMGEVNPEAVILFSEKYLHHESKEVRREICHGLELRGRTHPQDVLPLIKQLQWDNTARVYNMVIHVIGQIAYKKACLPKVVEDLKSWENKDIVQKCLKEIIIIHERYKDFSYLTPGEAQAYINEHFNANFSLLN